MPESNRMPLGVKASAIDSSDVGVIERDDDPDVKQTPKPLAMGHVGQTIVSTEPVVVGVVVVRTGA
jgi:hypothetical protein